MKRKVIQEFVPSTNIKRGRGRPKGSTGIRKGEGKQYQLQWTIAGQKVDSLYIETIKQLKLYLCRLIRGIEQKLIPVHIGNTIIGACKLIMDCIKEHRSEKVIDERIKKLEEIFSELRSKAEGDGAREISWPALLTEARQSGKKFDQMDNIN